MKYPEFFNTIETIKLRDKLSDLLGVFEDGIVEFSYLDIVKSAGHSCPTVAGAYIMTLIGLRELYKDELPKRGEVIVFFKEAFDDGVAGVIANVVTQITGATELSGFKGLGGRYARDGLMHFNANISSSIRLQRVDNGEAVELVYDPSIVEQNPQSGMLMQKILQGLATQEEKTKFAQLWQERVKKIFERMDEVVKIF
jgi:formylmethanofuran dehydrogenase subunit E